MARCGWQPLVVSRTLADRLVTVVSLPANLAPQSVQQSEQASVVALHREQRRAWQSAADEKVTVVEAEVEVLRRELAQSRRRVQELTRLHAAESQNQQAGVAILRQMEAERERLAREEAAVNNALLDKLQAHVAEVQQLATAERVRCRAHHTLPPDTTTITPPPAHHAPTHALCARNLHRFTPLPRAEESASRGRHTSRGDGGEGAGAVTAAARGTAGGTGAPGSLAGACGGRCCEGRQAGGPGSCVSDPYARSDQDPATQGGECSHHSVASASTCCRLTADACPSRGSPPTVLCRVAPRRRMLVSAPPLSPPIATRSAGSSSHCLTSGTSARASTGSSSFIWRRCKAARHKAPP